MWLIWSMSAIGWCAMNPNYFAGPQALGRPRIVSHFSCGAASAVATKLALQEYGPSGFVILRAWLAKEDADNDRFAAECEEWFGHPIITVADWKYKADPHEVFRKHRFILHRGGAKCSQKLKRDVLDSLVSDWDVFVMGYTAEEQGRLDRFLDANNGRHVLVPLIRKSLTKADCLAMIERAGIALPKMYLRGYNNNNCACCPKGGEGYMNRQRVDFPETFESLCQIQDVLGPGSYLYRNRKTGERISLRDLSPTAGRHNEPDISCSLFCELAERDIEEQAHV